MTDAFEERFKGVLLGLGTEFMSRAQVRGQVMQENR